MELEDIKHLLPEDAANILLNLIDELPGAIAEAKKDASRLQDSAREEGYDEGYLEALEAVENFLKGRVLTLI